MKPGKYNILQLLGVVLIVSSLAMMIFFQWYTRRSAASASQIASELEALLPQRHTGMPGDFSDPDMPMLEINGTDFCGLLEVPAYGIALPVGGQWDEGKVFSHPCRYFGSVYESNLVLGGSDQAGQMDFCGKVNPGAHIYMTDMTGAEFRYAVSRVDRAKKLDADKLLSGDWALTLFVRDFSAMEYLLVRCEPA